MALIDVCAVDGDCRINEMCFSNTSFFTDLNDAQLQELSDAKEGITLLGCECNTWYAWQGENCDQLSAETRFFAIWAIFLNLINAFLFFKLLYSFWLYVGNLRRGQRLKFNAHISSILFLALGIIGNALWTLSLITSSFAVDGDFLAEDVYLESDPFRGRKNVYGFFGAFIGTVFSNLAALNVCLLWIEVANKLNKYNYFRQSQLKNTRRFLGVYLILLILAFVFVGSFERLSSNNNPNIIGFVFLPLTITLATLFLVGAQRFTRVIEDLVKTSRRESEVQVSQRTNSYDLLSMPDEMLRQFSKESELERESVQVQTDSTELAMRKKSSFLGNMAATKKLKSTLQLVTATVQRNLKVDEDVLKDPKFQKVVISVRNTAYGVTFGNLLFSICAFIYATIDTVNSRRTGVIGIRESLNPNVDFGLVKFLYFLQVTSAVIGSYFLVQYLKVASSNQ